MVIKFYCIFFLYFFIFQGLGYTQDYGLAFCGQEVLQENRTGLDLTPTATLPFDEEFDLSFDLSFNPGHSVYFGYIFRLIDDNGDNIDLIYDERFEVHKRFKLIIGEKVSDIVFDIPLKELFSTWHRLRFIFNKRQSKIKLFVDDDCYEHFYLFPKDNRLKILFGANNFQEHQVTDVPSMKVKQLSITEKEVLKYHWPLDDVSGTKATETVKGLHARIRPTNYTFRF